MRTPTRETDAWATPVATLSESVEVVSSHRAAGRRKNELPRPGHPSDYSFLGGASGIDAKMNIPKFLFWNLREPADESPRYTADWDKSVHLEQILCTVNPDHRRAGKRATDLSVVLPKRQTFDVMWTWGNECLIQQRTLEVFQQQGFTGFQVKPVRARFRRPARSEPPRFWELVITGWAGMASPESGIQLDRSKSCPYCGSLEYTRATDFSRLIDEKTWDGGDFFMVWPLPKFIFVTDRVREFIQKNGIRLTQLVRPGDLQPKTPIAKRLHNTGFSPGRLSRWMPEDRAHQLGDPLGIY